jgi:hypothetical protein
MKPLSFMSLDTMTNAWLSFCGNDQILFGNFIDVGFDPPLQFLVLRRPNDHFLGVAKCNPNAY